MIRRVTKINTPLSNSAKLQSLITRRRRIGSTSSYHHLLRRCLQQPQPQPQLQQQQRFYQIHQIANKNITYNIRSFTATAAVAGGKQKTEKSKTVGDVFLDHLGKIFLSGIGLIVAALIRSSMGTTNQTNVRIRIEEELSVLDPFEIDDLRAANSDLTKDVFESIVNGIIEEYSARGSGNGINQKVDYREFVSIVMKIMKGIKGEGFTIQLSHLLDRVIISLLQKQKLEGTNTNSTMNIQDTTNFATDDASMSSFTHDNKNDDDDGKIELSLLLVALGLCLNSSIRDRVNILFNIMIQKQNAETTKQTQMQTNTSNQDATTALNVVDKKYIIDMVGYLQQTCQLVADAQIIKSETKYPIQQYCVGTPMELTTLGITMKKEELSEGAMVMEGVKTEEKNTSSSSSWTCDDFNHLLRSRAVCAWGECYVKKKGLE